MPADVLGEPVGPHGASCQGAHRIGPGVFEDRLESLVVRQRSLLDLQDVCPRDGRMCRFTVRRTSSLSKGWSRYRGQILTPGRRAVRASEIPARRGGWHRIAAADWPALPSRRRPSPCSPPASVPVLPSPGCLREGAKSYAKVEHVLCRWRGRLGFPGSRGEDLLARLAQLSLLDPEVRCRARTLRGVGVYHRGLREPHLSFRQRELPAALSPARP